jgi:mono/diheme cytochrome c family protein
MHNIPSIIAIASVLYISLATADEINPSRGEALYEIRCIECHGVSVHSRQNRVAKNYDEVRNWTTRWNQTLGGLWDNADVEDVTSYLNQKYYRYPCTGLQC